MKVVGNIQKLSKSEWMHYGVVLNTSNMIFIFSIKFQRSRFYAARMMQMYKM